MMIGTSDHLAREIAATQRALLDAEQQQRSHEDDDKDDRQEEPSNASPMQRLQRLQCQATELELAQQVSVYVRDFEHAEAEEDSTTSCWPRLEALGSLLLRHTPPPPDQGKEQGQQQELMCQWCCAAGQWGGSRLGMQGRVLLQ